MRPGKARRGRISPPSKSPKLAQTMKVSYTLDAVKAQLNSTSSSLHKSDKSNQRYGIKCRKIKRWEDLKIESIRNDCFKEFTGDGIQTFYDGQYICHEEIKSAIRRSLMYNIKNKRKWIQFKPSSNTTVAYHNTSECPWSPTKCRDQGQKYP